MTSEGIEQTLVLIKPEAMQLSLTGYILSQFSEFHTGLRFAGMKVVHVSRMLADEHYAEHRGKPFFPALLEYITGGVHYKDAPEQRRVIAIAYTGPGAVKTVRTIAGPTNPHTAREEAPGTIRALGTVVPVKDDDGNVIDQRMDNLVHGSATPEEAAREIKLWFRPNDIMPYMRAYPAVMCNDHYYFKGGELHTTHVPDSTCLMAPGETVWQSDLETLEQIAKGEETEIPLNAVAAKYLINMMPGD